MIQSPPWPGQRFAFFVQVLGVRSEVEDEREDERYLTGGMGGEAAPPGTE